MQQMESSYVERLRSEFNDIHNAVLTHLQSLAHTAGDKEEYSAKHKRYSVCWEFATQEERDTAEALRKKIVEFGGPFLEAVRLSPLLESIDEDSM